MRDIRNFETIDINDRGMKIALIMSKPDEEESIKDAEFLDKVKNTFPKCKCKFKTKSSKD